MQVLYVHRGHGNGTKEQPFALHDETASGARLRVGSANLPSGEFLLSFDGDFQRRCIVAWQSGGEIGVKFVDNADHAHG